jgi:methylenetetrahydrofolate reductase (NADPH)
MTQHSAPDKGTGIPASDPTRKHSLLISEGQGSLGREATWDDFPNGRFGPSQSPAFGQIDGYRPTLKVGPVTARKLWGSPKSAQDITTIFRKHVDGELQAVPWSDEVNPEDVADALPALRAETATIRTELLALIEKGYWTVASQPAVDGVRSDDEVFGWGPKGEGFCFQRPFCEFLTTKEKWEKEVRPKLAKVTIEEASWMKTDAHGVYESSDGITSGRSVQSKTTSKRAPGTSVVNAVTWGVFRGREIITPTIIESESFRAWAEEAFTLFSEWAACFKRGSAECTFLEHMKDNTVLVSVVGQRYVGEEGVRLWQLLLE